MFEPILRIPALWHRFVRIFVGELIEREADARGEALRLGDRLAVIAEQPRHLGGRFQMPFGMGGETLAGMIDRRSEEHTSELQSLMRISYAVFCLKKTIMHTQITVL